MRRLLVRRLLGVVGVVGVSLAVSACGSPNGSLHDVGFVDDFFVDDAGYQQSALTVHHSEAHGSLGGVLVDGDAVEIIAIRETWGGSASSHVTSYFNPAPGVWAMTRIELYGGIDHPSVAPGQILTNDEGNWGYDPNALYISAVGCSGDAKDVWDWDSPTSDVEVNVELAPTDAFPGLRGDTLSLNYTVNFRSYDGPANSVTGTVVLER